MEDALTTKYEEFLRKQITELRLKANVSEHRMSLELGKSGSYLRGITSGKALPSMREFFNILSYLDTTPAEFFAADDNQDNPRAALNKQLQSLDADDMEKVALFIQWIKKAE